MATHSTQREENPMTYFTAADHNQLAQTYLPGPHDSAYLKMRDLHDAIQDKIRLNDWNLHPHWQKSQRVTHLSAAATNAPENVLAAVYYRSYEQARVIEDLMAIDQEDVLPMRHPVIEMRLAADYFAVELILSPLAWWDQKNFIGKFEIRRHRDALRALMLGLDGDYHLGFWGGESRDDADVSIWQLLQGRLLGEWVATFCEGQDWLRFGVWYEPEASQLRADHIVHEVTQRVGELYRLYDFLLWSSNNNYHEFLESSSKRARSARTA
jgi:hypothetical protein